MWGKSKRRNKMQSDSHPICSETDDESLGTNDSSTECNTIWWLELRGISGRDLKNLAQSYSKLRIGEWKKIAALEKRECPEEMMEKMTSCSEARCRAALGQDESKGTTSEETGFRGGEQTQEPVGKRKPSLMMSTCTKEKRFCLKQNSPEQLFKLLGALVRSTTSTHVVDRVNWENWSTDQFQAKLLKATNGLSSLKIP